eukprot:scpid77198/ scgid1078/ F-box only protein 4
MPIEYKRILPVCRVLQESILNLVFFSAYTHSPIIQFLVQLHLFSYLDAHSLCQAAMVSWEWNALASDHLLWKRLLCRDSAKWQEVGHGTHPAIFSEAASDLPSKEIYLRCHPQASKVFGTCTPANITSPWNLPLRMSRWFKRTFNVAVFGPGLDSLPIAQRLVFGTDAIFKPTGMTPGHHGVGSGVSIRHGDNTFNLMILYKATKAERTRASDVDEINRLLHQAPNGSVGENAAGAAANENVRAQPVAELTTRVKDMCKTVDAFLCVVDNRKPTKTSTAPLIHGMMAAAPSGQHRTPLLVMSTTGSRTEECRSCVVDEASTLRLTLLNHPWKMQSARLDSPDTIFSALDWLVEQV